MKKTVKIIVTLLTCAALMLPKVLASTMPDPPAKAADTGAKAAAATSREEVIYANLTADGSVKDVYAVCILSVAQAGLVVDYGGYKSVKNLTNTDDVTLESGKVYLTAPAGDFYYQGELQNAQLPWLIRLSSRLDGKELPPAQLAGKSGHAELRISTAQNTNADPSYYENYILQVSLTFDNSRFRNITAPEGTIANAGGDKLVTFTVMPGTSAELTVEADVTDFTMQGFELAALPMSFNIDTPDTDGLSEDLKSLSEAVGELDDASEAIHSGSYDLKTGAEGLKTGSSSFIDGLLTLKNSSANLVSGSSEVMNTLAAITTSLYDSSGGLDVSALSKLPENLEELSGGIDSISSGLTELSGAFSDSYAVLNAAIQEIPDAEVSQQELMTLYQNNPGQKGTLDVLSDYYVAAAKVKATYQAVQKVFNAVAAVLGESAGSLDMMSASLSVIAAQLRTSLSGESASMLLQLSEGLGALSAGYEDFHKGLVAYTSGVTALTGSYGEVNNGIYAIAGGIEDLYDGISRLYNGTAELHDATKDMPEQVDDKIRELISSYDKSDFIPASFTSVKNTNTVSVQFVLKTDKIEKDEPEIAETPEKPEGETFWTRFLALFQ